MSPSEEAAGGGSSQSVPNLPRLLGFNGAAVSLRQWNVNGLVSRTFPFRPSSYHPAARRWRLWIALSWKKASDAGGQTDHCSQLYTGWQGFNLWHEVPHTVLPSFCSFLCPLLCWPTVDQPHTFSFISHCCYYMTVIYKLPWQHAVVLLWRVSSQ